MESMTKQVEECLESSDCYGGWNLKEQHREDFESTYGLKYLIGGVYDAYKDYYKTKLITINIK